MDTTVGRILIVDDNPPLRKVMTTYLSRLGYAVVSCTSAEQAWALMQAGPAGYSLAVVDLNMPGMRGEELAQRILESNESIHLIVASGYPEELSGVQALDRKRVAFLHKPFTPDELAQVVSTRVGRSAG